MKGKLLKKVVAAVATIAMASQFAFVLPASAATIASQDYESATVGADSGKTYGTCDTSQETLKIASDDTTPGIGKYISSDWSDSNNTGGRGTDIKMPSADVTSLDKFVVEYDQRMSAFASQGSCEFYVKTSSAVFAASSATRDRAHMNNGLEKGFLLKMVVGQTGTTTINGAKDTISLETGTWYHHKLIVDREEGYVSVNIYKVTKNGTERTLTPVTEKTVVGVNGDSRDVTGFVNVIGRANGVMDLDNILVRNVESTDEFGDLPPEYVNTYGFAASVSEGTILPSTVTPPKEEGATEAYKLELSAVGTLAHNIFTKYPNNYTVDWKVEGLSNEDGYINIILDDGSDTNLTTSPNDTVTGSKATKATVNIRDGVSNWFGNITATLHYTASDGTEETKTVNKQFFVVAAAANSSIIYPATGYPIEANGYDDSFVGYKASSAGTAYNVRDTILGWTIGAGNGEGYIELCKEEETGDKYLDFSTGANSNSKSTVADINIGNITSEFAIDTVMKFTSEANWGYYNTTPNNGNLVSAFQFTYNGGEISSGEGKVSGLANDTWYRIVIYCDRATGIYSLYVFDAATGAEIGSIKDQTTGCAVTDGLAYFATSLGTSANVHRYIKSCKIYYPTINTIVLNSESATVGVPAVDADKLKGKGLEDSSVYTYDSENNKLYVDVADITEAQLIVANYSKKQLTDFDINDLTFTPTEVSEGVTKNRATVDKFELPDSCRLFLWKKDWTGIEPVVASEGTGVDNPNRETVVPVTMDITAQLTSTDGFDMASAVEWSIDTDDPAIELVEEEAQKVTLKVSEGAPAGPVIVTAKNGAKVMEKEIILTTTGNSVSFTQQTGSITIPFSGSDARSATYAARTMTKDGQVATVAYDDDGNATETPAAITYTVLDKNLVNITNKMPAGVTFNAETGELSVSSDAKSNVIYIQATNNDATPLSRSVKVNIHGLSFAFGSDEPSDDSFTKVTGNETYNVKTGYGFADTSNLTTNAGNVSGSDAYQFKLDVPNGNYNVTLNTSADTVTSEVVDGIAAVTGISKNAKTKFAVAVVDGILDLTFPANATVTSIAVEQRVTDGSGKPKLYAIGDSTTNNTGNGAKSWGNCVGGENVVIPESLAGFSNNGMAGRDSVNFYNQGRVETVLLAIKPGDYVTVNMGINSKEAGEAASYFTLLDTYYVTAIEQRGGIPIIVTATPQGPVGNYTGNYSGGVFNCGRGTGAHNGDLRTIAKNHNLNIIELGEWGDVYFNSLTAEDATAAGKSTVLELVQSWYVDHNHYKQELGDVIANYLLDCVDKIIKDPAAFNWTKDSNISAD